MTRTLINTVCLSLFAGSLATLGACGNDSGGNEKQASKAVETVIPASYFTSERPSGSVMLTDVKANAKVGDKVVVEARVGGRAEPFVDGVAMFVAADPRLVSCDQRPGDHCKVPHDYCCEHPDAMKAGTATIQMVDSDGNPFPVRAEGQGGIQPLKTVVITGVVTEKDEGGTLVIDGTTMWVGTIPAAPPGAS